MKLTEFLQDVGRPIAYFPKLKRLTGSTTATILLCQFIYWIGKEADKDGWLYKTSEEIEEETGLTYNEQKTARKALVEAGLLEEYYARLEHQLRFRVCLDKINEKWGNEQPQNGECDDSTFGNDESPRSLNSITEITTENIPLSIENAIFAGKPVVTDERVREELEACAAFERAFGIERPWNWFPPKDEKLWAEFRAKLRELWKQDANCFEGYARWANAPYSRGAKNASQLRRDPSAFWDAWAAYKASEMYRHKTDEERPTYKTRRMETLER